MSVFLCLSYGTPLCVSPFCRRPTSFWDLATVDFGPQWPAFSVASPEGRSEISLAPGRLWDWNPKTGGLDPILCKDNKIRGDEHHYTMVSVSFTCVGYFGTVLVVEGGLTRTV